MMNAITRSGCWLLLATLAACGDTTMNINSPDAGPSTTNRTPGSSGGGAGRSALPDAGGAGGTATVPSSCTACETHSDCTLQKDQCECPTAWNASAHENDPECSLEEPDGCNGTCNPNGFVARCENGVCQARQLEAPTGCPSTRPEDGDACPELALECEYDAACWKCGCIAQAGGPVFHCTWDCTTAVFPCGDAGCQMGSEFCQHNVADESYQCRTLPGTCSGSRDCECFAEPPCDGSCGYTKTNGGLEWFEYTCPY